MSRSSLSPQAPIRLPEVHAIGFTGDRHQVNEALCRRTLEALLREQAAVPERMLLGVSVLAAGADLLFAETCVALAIPLHLVVPSSHEQMRRGVDTATWARMERVLGAARSVASHASDEASPERVYECGVDVVQRTQTLIAVWNGRPAGGLSGAEEIVDFATRMGRPILWIASETGELKELAGRASTLARDELRFLNELPDLGVTLAEDAPGRLAEAWLAKLDANAVSVAPQVRRLATVPIVCTAIAATVSGVAPRMQAISVWSGVGAALGLTAALLSAVLRLAKRQALWVRIRTAAEVTRSVLAVWPTPLPYGIAGNEVLPELGDMIRSLNALNPHTRQDAVLDLERFKQRYLAERVEDQSGYFLRQSEKAARQGQKYRRMAKYSVVLAVVLSVWTFVAHLLLGAKTAFAGGSVLAIVTSALFQLATIAGALLVVEDCNRRERRYGELHDVMTAFAVELRAFRSWPTVLGVVGKIERALLVELLEWRSLLQNLKMPRS